LRQRRLWSTLLVFAMFGAIAAPLAHARAHRSESWAREQFAAAERMREALNGRPLTDRTRHDYQRVLNAYRALYHGAPRSTKADPSVVAVAETLVEMGRRFEDDKILHRAIEQYKFLRREYPGSKYRFEALFTIGEIYQDDLNDPPAARAAFQEFLRRYPRHHLADDARQAVVALDPPAPAKVSETRSVAEQKSPQSRALDKEAPDEEVPDEAPDRDKNGVRGAVRDRQDSGELPAKEESAGREQSPDRDNSAKDEEPDGNRSGRTRTSRLARVTGIRHWSTPDYTRVAIDVESNVDFSSQRIAHPARIYFDLRDTRLASTLVGKSFDVDDGFLQKVRVAQFAPRRTRIVLEVDNLSDYDAFLLHNPTRLIIDIHGKDIHGKNSQPRVAPRAAETAESPASPNAIPEKDSDKGTLDESTTDATVPVETASSEKSTDTETSGLPAASSALASPQQKTVVKRVVEAEEEDGVPIPPPSAPRRQDPAIRSAASKEHDLVDLDGDSASGSASSRVTRSSPDDARRKSSSHILASSRPTASELAVREAKPTVSSGDRSLIRALGLKIGKIVIDPGHGGHDTGTIGPNGLEEKDLVLDVGRRLGKLLETRLGAEVVYTRKDDTFIPLETRTAIANQARADLFISIHANSSHDSAARGVETYYLNFTSSPDALEVAARENAVSETSIYELQDLVKKIALKEKIEESREFAWEVEQSLHSGLAAKSPAIRDRGVKKAPFIVLIGANMPSILAEISFVSNPTDERRLSTGEYRQRIAESLYRGISNYVNGLSGVKVASKLDRAAAR
jgi:N-acetylmuramoyl-L-alanine amidase